MSDESKILKTNILQWITSVISVILSLHYLYSYWWITGLLKIHGLDNQNLISFEDLTIPFGSINRTLFLFGFSGFLWILIMKLLLKEDDYKDFGKKLIKDFKTSLINAKGLLQKENRKQLIMFILFLISIIIASSIYTCYYPIELVEINWTFGITFLLIFVVFPLVYITCSTKKTLVLIVYLISIVIWSNFFIKLVLRKLQEGNVPKSGLNLKSFDIGKKTIEAKNQLLIYNGYKSFILKDTISNEYIIYPSSEIKKLTIK